MRKGRAAALAAATVASVAALSLLLLLPEPTPTPTPTPADQPAPPSQVAEIDLGADLDLDPAVPQPATADDAPARGSSAARVSHASSVNAFAFDLYRTVAADGEENGRNIFFSPASIHTAFSILYEGARGNTAQQIVDAFGFEPDRGARHAAAAAAAASIGRGDGHSELSLANALWVAEHFTPYDSYLEAARGDAYGATVDTVVFTDEADAVPRINAWASDNTAGRIEKVIVQRDVNDLTAMVITNAIYFKGVWTTQFPEDGTREGEFMRGDGSAAPADFMEVTAKFDHAAYDGYQVLRMPYEGGRLSMLVVLPGEPGGLDRLAGGLSPATLDRWIVDTERREVRVVMPRFEAKTNYDLEGVLGALGVTDAFDEKRADLTGIGESKKEGRLYVSKASHDAYVGVDEKGTEAAAVTTVIVELEAERPLPVDFVADRPFLFAIHDGETGAILFMGRLSDPAGPR